MNWVHHKSIAFTLVLFICSASNLACVPSNPQGGVGANDAGEDASSNLGEDAGNDAGDDAGDDAGNNPGEDAGNDAGDDAGDDAGNLLGNASPCGSSADCASGFCVDGLCCDNAYTDACKACNVAGQEGICAENFPGACSGQCNGEIGLPDAPLLEGGGYMAAGDLDGDGLDDLVVGGTNVFLARGKGFFDPGDSYPLVPHGSKVLADLDNDGDLDLVVASGLSTYVLNNVGNGSLNGQMALPLTGNAFDVTTGDFNGDGFVDIAVAHGDVSVFLNQGGVNFAPSAVYMGFSTARLSTADMDGDGDYDLVLMNSTHFRILMNPGNGAFTQGTTTVTDMYGNYFDLATADADSDGDVDILMTDIELCGVRYKLNPGNGSYPPVTMDLRACTTFQSNHELLVGDFNGDTKPDYLSPLGDKTNVFVGLAGGGGSQSYFAGMNPGTLAAGDFDGDGDLDAAVSTTPGIRILRNTGSGSFPNQGPLQLDIGTSATLANADVNGDGLEDLLHTTSTGISVLTGVGNAVFNAPVSYSTGSGPGNIVARDVNGDGKPDLAVANSNGSTVSVLLNQGNGTYGSKVDYATGNNPYSLVLEDVNGDNQRDLVVGSSNRVTIFLNQGAGAFGNGMDFFIGHFGKVAALDVTGDGLKDVVVGPAANGVSALGKLINQGNGSFMLGAQISVKAPPTSVVAADFDGNGNMDLALGYYNDDSLGVLLNDGNGTITVKNVPKVVGYGGFGITVADMNVDGFPDVLTSNEIVNGGPKPFILFNAGSGTAFRKEIRATSAGCCTTMSNIISGDFNEDGFPDFTYNYGYTVYFHMSTCLQ